MIAIYAPEGCVMVTGALMTWPKRVFHHLAQRWDDHFPASQPRGVFPSYRHTVSLNPPTPSAKTNRTMLNKTNYRFPSLIYTEGGLVSGSRFSIT